MELTGEQFERLEQALIAAYPNESALSRMVRIIFDKKLPAIAEGKNHTERVDQLIEWAEQENNVVALVRGAHRRQPTSSGLRNFCDTHLQCLLADACTENCSGLKAETILALTCLPFAQVPSEAIVAAGLTVLPTGATDDPSDKDFTDFRHENLTLAVRLYGFFKLALTKFSQFEGKPTLLQFAYELCDQLADDSLFRAPLESWIQRAETEVAPAPTALRRSRLTTRQGNLEASLMITVRLYSKQKPNQPLQYQVDACLYFDQISGRPSPHILDRPPLSLPLPDTQEKLGVVCTWKQIPERVEQFLGVATSLLAHQLKRELGYGAFKLTIELFLPVEQMGVAVDQWPKKPRNTPVGQEYGVLVRFCDRLTDDERWNEIYLAWEKLQALLQTPQGVVALSQHIEAPPDLNQYASWRHLEAKLKQKLGLKLCCGLPASEADKKGLFEAMLYGDIPIAVWTRSADIVDAEVTPAQAVELPQALSDFLAVEYCQNPTILAEKLKAVRQQTWLDKSDERYGRCLGNHIAFLLDNPDRSPLLPALAS